MMMIQFTAGQVLAKQASNDMPRLEQAADLPESLLDVEFSLRDALKFGNYWMLNASNDHPKLHSPSVSLDRDWRMM